MILQSWKLNSPSIHSCIWYQQ